MTIPSSRAKVSENFQDCAYCQSASPHLLSYAGRDYFRCRFCDLIFRPRSEKGDDAQTKHYRDDYFKLSSDDQLDKRRLLLYERIVRRIERVRRPGALLDVGCGRGVFLTIAQRRGWSVTGIDLSIESIRDAEENLKGHVFCSTLDSLGVQKAYDVITLIDVLDHMLDVRRDMAYAMSVLHDDGLLYMRFPNALFHASVLKFAYRIRPVAEMQSYVIFHQYALTPKFVRRLLGDAGFSKIAIRNSPLAGSSVYRVHNDWRPLSGLLNHMVFLCAATMALLTGGRLVIGPSLEVTALKS